MATAPSHVLSQLTTAPAATVADASLHEARRTERVFSQLLESAPDAIVGSGPDGRIVLANHRAGEMFGYARSELIGQQVEPLVPGWLGGSGADRRYGHAPDAASKPPGAALELVAFAKTRAGSPQRSTSRASRPRPGSS